MYVQSKKEDTMSKTNTSEDTPKADNKYCSTAEICKQYKATHFVYLS